VNLRAGGPVEIERHGCRQAVVPVVLQGDERERAFAAVFQAFPHVRLYLSGTSRRFPVVRLEAIDAHATDPAAGQPPLPRRGDLLLAVPGSVAERGELGLPVVSSVKTAINPVSGRLLVAGVVALPGRSSAWF
jgi:hypothetical protein